MYKGSQAGQEPPGCRGEFAPLRWLIQCSLAVSVRQMTNSAFRGVYMKAPGPHPSRLPADTGHHMIGPHGRDDKERLRSGLGLHVQIRGHQVRLRLALPVIGGIGGLDDLSGIGSRQCRVETVQAIHQGAGVAVKHTVGVLVAPVGRRTA